MKTNCNYMIVLYKNFKSIELVKNCEVIDEH